MAPSVAPVEVPTELTVSPRLLAYELARRGKGWVDLSRGEHRLNPTTVGKLRHRLHVTAATRLRLGQWLAATPVLPELDAVLSRPESAAR